MNIVPGKTTLVIAGAFNPAILTPVWILRNVLDRAEDENLEVEILAPINGSGPTRFSFEGFSFTPSTQRLVVHLDGLDSQQGDLRTGQTASILERLAHTPISGVGFNFGFQSDAPSSTATSMFSMRSELMGVLGEQAEVVTSIWGTRIKCDGDLVSASANLAGTNMELDLNFHISSSAVEDVIQVLRAERAFTQRLQKAQDFATTFNS